MPVNSARGLLFFLSQQDSAGTENVPVFLHMVQMKDALAERTH